MPLLSGIYDTFFQPVVRIKENISILTGNIWRHYVVDFIEGIPPGSATTIDFVAVAAITVPGYTALPANGQITKRVVTALQLVDKELIQLRFAPVDNIEVLLYEQQGTARLNPTNVQARVDPTTRAWDTTLASTTFSIFGQNRDAFFEIRNLMAYAMPMARVRFWGWRYIVGQEFGTNLDQPTRKLLEQGDRAAVSRVVGATTYFPSEGKAA